LKFFSLKINLLSTVNTPAKLTLASACLLVASLLWSPFLLSLSMWGLVAAALWQSAETVRAEGRVGGAAIWGRGVLRGFRVFAAQPMLVALSLLLWVPALSFFWSDDLPFWLERTRVRLPFFVLPWAFANLPTLTRRHYHLVLYLLVWVLVLLCAGVGIHFLLHTDEILTGLGRGHPIPVPRSHIRFSLTLALGILVAGWLWQRRFVWRFAWERRVLLAATLFLFAFIHFLSVRSGLAALYIGLVFSVLHFVWHTRRWKTGLAALALMAIVPLVAASAIPSLRVRVAYMVWDWQQYVQQKGDGYSDSERWVSLQAGLDIWRAHPWVGVGAGDLPAATQQVVGAKYPLYAAGPKLPHNQFVYILAGTGLLGLLLSLWAFSAPWWARAHRRFYPFVVSQIMVFVSFLVEYTIETAIGVAYYLFFTLWFARMGLSEQAPENPAKTTA
jgi:O-antigen ligase